MNNVKVFTLMAALTASSVALGGYFGGQSGMMMMLVVAGADELLHVLRVDEMVLRMYGAQIVDAAAGAGAVRDGGSAAAARRAADADGGDRAARAAERVRHRTQSRRSRSCA